MTTGEGYLEVKILDEFKERLHLSVDFGSLIINPVIMTDQNIYICVYDGEHEGMVNLTVYGRRHFIIIELHHFNKKMSLKRNLSCFIGFKKS